MREEKEKTMGNKRTITYYAFAKNANGKLEQLKVVRVNGRQLFQSWTGKVYRTMKSAYADMERLNCKS